MKLITRFWLNSAIIFAIAAQAQADTAQRIQLPAHAVGRVQVETARHQSSYTYSWPGVYFEAEFNGPSLDVELNDDQNILNLIVDDKPAIELIKPGKTTYSLRDLGEGKHRVRLEKRTETQWSLGKFDGFFIPKNQTPLKITPNKRKIEFIGDSFTVGYGNTSTTRECSNEDVYKTTNTQLAFAPIAAKHFNADYHINASSGFGVVRNYNGGSPEKSLLTLYPYTLNNAGEIYKSDWSPQIIVIGLGTNDFSTPLNANEKWKTREELQNDYVAHYVDFIESLHKQHKNANFILMASDANNSEIAQQVARVVTAITTKGKIPVDSIIFTGLDYAGCHWHPSTKDDQKVASLLIGLIEGKPSLWNGK